MKKIKVGSDFSGVGAFDQALKRLGVKYETVFACDMDKYARDTFIHNYGEPKYYPMNVYDRKIPAESLDIYMTSPPCQAFSLAGKRLGKDDKRGVLFFNSHEFIQVNKPRFFIFENVKGLLSDDGGKTFQEWINMLGGKSVNGLPVLFAHDDAVPYHLYWKVLNAKHHGVPQNRERVFLVGIRDDADNQFQFPREEYLSKRLKDVLEQEVDSKYFLSEKMINGFLAHNKRHIEEKGQDGFNWKPKDENDVAACIRANAALAATDNTLKVGVINQDTQASTVYSENGVSQSMTAGTHGYAMGYIQVKSGTSKGFDEATEGDSINFGFITSDTRRDRVGKGVAQTLDTACNQATIVGTWRTHKDGQGFREIEDGNCPTIPARAREDGSGQPVIQNNYTVRRLTPRECFRLMDFPDTFSWKVSDSQAYKQAGNSIVANVLYKILKQLPI
jgi:DNA (cytosine-5)-methyltransferase 1